jgi:small-conductance mechanosensitive channel
VLRYLSRLLNSVPASKGLHRILVRVFPLVEFIIWLAYGLWVLNGMFGNYPFYTLLVSALAIGLLVIVGWYFLRDFIAGIILKAEIPFEQNQLIKVIDSKGVLRKVGYRSLEIETDEGEFVKIPYSKLAANSIHLFERADNLQSFETILRLSSSKSIQQFKDDINQFLLLLPWVAFIKEPRVRLIAEGESENTYSVTYYTTSSRLAARVSEHLRSQFQFN